MIIVDHRLFRVIDSMSPEQLGNKQQVKKALYDAAEINQPKQYLNVIGHDLSYYIQMLVDEYCL